jgi:hypothetical protein
VKNAYKIFIGKPEEKRSLEGPENRWQDNITVDIRGIKCEVVSWIELNQCRVQ